MVSTSSLSERQSDDECQRSRRNERRVDEWRDEPKEQDSVSGSTRPPRMRPGVEVSFQAVGTVVCDVNGVEGGRVVDGEVGVDSGTKASVCGAGSLV